MATDTGDGRGDRRKDSSSSSSSSCTWTDSYCCEGEYEEAAPCAEDEAEPSRESSVPRQTKPGAASLSPAATETPEPSSGSSVAGREPFAEEPPESVCDGEMFSPCREEEAASARGSVAGDEEESRKESIFPHGSPSQFPDIVWARRSVFGSIFVKAAVAKQPGSLSYRQTGAESQFSMIPAFLDSAKESESQGSEKRTTAKGSVFRAFEKRGIAKETSGTSSSQWDVFPITKSALFSFQMNDRVHQTRHLSRIEDRITNAPMQILKFAYNWPSGSKWTGHWDGLGMAGAGTYVMPHEVCYIGKMQDGTCHDDDAILVYPNGFRALHCNYVNGDLTDYQFQFPDSLDHEKENWEYCRYPDRRFWSEVQNGLKPAKTAQKTQEDPPRKIPQDCYDTNDGFYNPKTKMLLGTDGDLLRVPTCEEARWIMSKCRKGFHEYTGFSPELYENWYGNDKELIRSIQTMREKRAAGEISHDELYRFYAENELLPSCSPYRRTRTHSELEIDKVGENVPPPKKLTYRLEKRYEGPGIVLRDASPADERRKKWSKRSRTVHGRDLDRTFSQEKINVRIKFDEGTKTSPTSAGANAGSEAAARAAVLRTTGSESEESAVPGEDRAGGYEREALRGAMKRIVMGIVDEILSVEREKHRDRLVRLREVGNVAFGPRDERERSVRALEELHATVPDDEEYCESADNECDLRNLAEDRFQTVRYWGKRIFTLQFDEKE